MSKVADHKYLELLISLPWLAPQMHRHSQPAGYLEFGYASLRGRRWSVMTIPQCSLVIGIQHPCFRYPLRELLCYCSPERTISRAREHLLHSEAASLPLPSAAVTYQDLSSLLPDFVHIVDLAPYKWLKNQWVLHGICVRLHARMMTRTVQFGREDKRGATKSYQLSKVRDLLKYKTDA